MIGQVLMTINGFGIFDRLKKAQLAVAKENKRN